MYTVRRLRTFVKARARRVWSIVKDGQHLTLGGARTHAEDEMSREPGASFAVFDGRKKVWP